MNQSDQLVVALRLSLSLSKNQTVVIALIQQLIWLKMWKISILRSTYRQTGQVSLAISLRPLSSKSSKVADLSSPVEVHEIWMPPISNDWIDRIRWSAWSGNCERNTDLRFRDLVAVSRIERRSSLATSRMRHFSHLWTPQGLTHALWIANEKCHVLKWEEMKFTRLEPSLKSKITQNRNRGDWSSRVKMQKKRKI